MTYEWPIWKKKCFEERNLSYGFLTKYHGSLNNPSRANGDFREQIFARHCNNSGETEEVNKTPLYMTLRYKYTNNIQYHFIFENENCQQKIFWTRKHLSKVGSNEAWPSQTLAFEFLSLVFLPLV